MSTQQFVISVTLGLLVAAIVALVLVGLTEVLS